MNAATILILAVILLLAGLAIWRTVKKGGGCDCASCQSSGECPHCHPGKSG